MSSSASRAPSEGWRSLRDVPELNRLLNNIYPGRKSVSAPSTGLTRVPRENVPAFIPGGGSANAGSSSASARKKKTSAVNVKAPKVGLGARRRPELVSAPYGDELEGRMQGCPQQYLGRRRPQRVIESEIRYISMRTEAYRPPHIKAVSTEEEKDRLAERFTFGGGKALPDELTIQKTVIPSHARAEAAEQERIMTVMARRAGEDLPAPGDPQDPSPERSAKELLYDQIMDEIDERQQYIARARKTGISLPGEEDRIRGEISLRVARLKQLSL
jgi:hypothetical protein